MSPPAGNPGRMPTPRDFPEYETKVELLCRPCGKKGKYLVGRIFIDPQQVPKPGEHRKPFGDAACFTGYFHCRHCGAGGPWDLTASAVMQLTALVLEAQVAPNQARIQFVQPRLFDGTVVRTATEGEAHLKKLIAANPNNDFLWERLGNLYDAAGQVDLARPAFQRAIELNPRNVGSHYTLGCYLMDRGQEAEAVPHFHAILRYCKTAQQSPTQPVHEMVRDALERLFDLHGGARGDAPFLPPFDPAPDQGADGRIPKTVLLDLDLSTDEGWETLATIYLTGKLPAPRRPQALDRWLAKSAAPLGGRPEARVGRNERCPCGSGKKFKHCCGRGR